MEYRRRRSARRRASESSGSGALRALVLVLLFGAAAYLLFGTGLLKKLKDEGLFIAMPEGCVKETAHEIDISGAAGTAFPMTREPESTALPTPAVTGETAEVSLPGITVCMIQMGICSSEEECAEKAAELRRLGAAGFVFNDGGSLRLIAASFSDEASAESVRERLAQEGRESTVYKLEREGAEFLITADPALMLPIRTAFSIPSDTVAQLDELSIDFDANLRSTDHAVGILAEIRTNLETALDGIEEASGSDAVLSTVKEYLEKLLGIVSETAEHTYDRTDMASALKRSRTEAALGYVLLLDGIGG